MMKMKKFLKGKVISTYLLNTSHKSKIKENKMIMLIIKIIIQIYYP
jgi:hypothetical protein